MYSSVDRRYAKFCNRCQVSGYISPGVSSSVQEVNRKNKMPISTKEAATSHVVLNQQVPSPPRATLMSVRALGPILSRPGTRHSRTPGRPRAFDTP